MAILSVGIIALLWPAPSRAATPLGCELQAARSLATCLKRVASYHRRCLRSGNLGCPHDDPRIVRTLDGLSRRVRRKCDSDANVQLAGFTSLTLDSLDLRLRSSCVAATDALYSRSVGGPHAPAWQSAPNDTRRCLEHTLRHSARLLSTTASTRTRCIRNHRKRGTCRLNRLMERISKLKVRTEEKIEGACDPLDLRDLIALTPTTVVERAAAQAECATAIAHTDRTPLTLQCGPRDAIAAPPRGQYVRIVLDETEWDTRCGTGNPYAFWIRLAPSGFPVENVVLQMQGGGACISEDQCNSVSAGLFSATDNNPSTGGIMSNDPAITPFANWTKVYLPYCTQDLFIGGGNSNIWPSLTVHRWGAINTRVSLRYLRDILWRQLDTDSEGYRPDRIRMLFGGTSAGGFGALYNYHYILDDLQWIHSTAWADSALALSNGELIGLGSLGFFFFNDSSPDSWHSRPYMPPYCTRTSCGLGPVIYMASAPRLKREPAQRFLVLSNQVDNVQVNTSFFDSTADWINTLRRSYCNSAGTNGLHYFLPAQTTSNHTIVTDTSVFAGPPVAGIEMRDWLDRAINDPDTLTDAVEEGSLVSTIPGVLPFACPVN